MMHFKNVTVYWRNIWPIAQYEKSVSWLKMLHARHIKPWHTMVNSPNEDLHNRNVLFSVGGIPNSTSQVGSPHSCQTRSKKLSTFHSSSSSKGVENKMSRQIENLPFWFIKLSWTSVRESTSLHGNTSYLPGVPYIYIDISIRPAHMTRVWTVKFAMEKT